MSDTISAWLTVRISDTDDDGVDSRLLSRLLLELSDSMLAAARFSLGDRRKRRGPATKAESKLAGLCLTSVSQGSVILEYRRPPGLLVSPPKLPGLETAHVTPDSVAGLVLGAAKATSEGAEIAPGEEPMRRSIRRFLETASKVGRSCEFDLAVAHSKNHRITVALHSLPSDANQPANEREVSLYGHVYMADVELGRQRLRIKLPNDTDVTMDLVPEIRESLLELLDKPVVLAVTEKLAKGFVVSRTVHDAQLLPPGLHGVEKPPKTLLELAGAQGLLNVPVPDFQQLASAVWPTPEDVAEALNYLQDHRKASA